MKKYMDSLTKLKAPELEKKATELRSDIEIARRSVMTGETTNHQTIKLKKRELARVNTLLAQAGSDEAEKPAKSADKEKK